MKTKENIIIFRIDRLGDFIIITSLLRALKKKYPESSITIVASKLNINFIKKYKIIDEVILYDKKFSLLKKFKIFKYIISKKYFVSFSIDGKTFSNFCNLFIRSKFKFGLFYKFYLFNFSFYKPNIFFKFIFDYCEIFTSKKHLQRIEHLPTKIISLGNQLGLKIKNVDKYYFKPTLDIPKFKKKYKNFIQKKYLLIHLDEKWCDIIDINKNLFNALIKLQDNTNKVLVLTTYKNKFQYYLNLKKNLIKYKIKKIKLIENSNLNEMERLIKYSHVSISCHSGFLVQISGANSTKIIDIINKNDYLWYSCWVPFNTSHKFIYKSINDKYFSINKILSDLEKIIYNSRIIS